MRCAIEEFIRGDEMNNEFKIMATSILGSRVWLVSLGEPIDVGGSLERPVKMSSNQFKGRVFASQEEAEQILPFVLKVRPDAALVSAKSEVTRT